MRSNNWQVMGKADRERMEKSQGVGDFRFRQHGRGIRFPVKQVASPLVCFVANLQTEWKFE